MKIKPMLRFTCGVLSVCSLIVGTGSGAIAQDNTEAGESFQIEFRDGTVVTRQLAMSTLAWIDVSKAGEMSKKPIELSQVESIKLATEPASQQLARVLRLIRQLDSEDFYLREKAEAELVAAGSRFGSVMEENDDLQTVDGVYRLRRVLSSLKSQRKKSVFELDVVTFHDGTKLSGDAGNDPFRVFSFDGQVREISRKLLADISRPKPVTRTRDQEPRGVNTKLFHNHAEFMKDRQLKLVDFEHKPDGGALGSSVKDITGTFVDWGLVLACESATRSVSISGYEFDGGDRPVGGNSICTAKPKRFYGVMELTFCQPGTKSVPHGVRDIGMFVARVNHSRDIIIQAWDAAGRLVGVCESADEPCTFLGVSSSVPIAKVRILSNPWLLELRKQAAEPGKKALQSVDEDFAIDSIMFSKPVPIDSPRSDRHYFGRNGDMIKASSLRIVSGNEVKVESDSLSPMVSDISSVNTLVLKAAAAPHLVKASAGRWLALLKDNSVLQWKTGKPFFSETLGRQIELADIVAVWPAHQAPRLPLAGDFENGGHVLVYPGCRVATGDLDLNRLGYSWTSQTVLTEDLHAEDPFKVDQWSNDKPDRVAPQSQTYQWDVSGLSAFEIPTVWLAAPTSMLAKQGAIKLEGGEVLVFGTGANFELQSLGRSEITVTEGGRELTVPLSKVTSIVAPQE